MVRKVGASITTNISKAAVRFGSFAVAGTRLALQHPTHGGGGGLDEDGGWMEVGGWMEGGWWRAGGAEGRGWMEGGWGWLELARGLDGGVARGLDGGLWGGGQGLDGGGMEGWRGGAY